MSRGLPTSMGVVYVTVMDVIWTTDQSTSARHLRLRGRKVGRDPGVASAALLSGLQPSGDHGLVASGGQTTRSSQGGYRSVALFVDLPSQGGDGSRGSGGVLATVGPSTALASGSYLSATQLVLWRSGRRCGAA